MALTEFEQMLRKDVAIGIKADVDPNSAAKVKATLQDALVKGTDPTKANRNVLSVHSSMMKLGNSIRQVGLLFMTYFGGRQLLRFVEESVMLFGRFDQRLQQSIAIMDKVDVTMRKKLGETARQVSRDLNIAAEDVAEGYYFLASAGFTAEQSLAAISAVATFAKAGMMDLARSTEQMTQVQAALGMKSEDAVQNLTNLQYIMDVISKAAAKSQGTITQFADALANKAGVSLRMFNKDVSEGVAALAVMADQGTKGRLAGERLDIFLRQVTQASIKHADAFKRYGIAVFDAKGHMRNMADVVGDLTKALGGLSDEQQVIALTQLGFQVRTIAVVKAFIGMEDKLRNYEKLLQSAGGTTEQFAKKQLQTPIEQFGLMKRKMEDARIELGERLIPTLTRLGHVITDENDPLSVVNALRAFAGAIDEDADAIGKAGGVLVWLTTVVLSELFNIFNIIADVIVVGVNVPLATLGLIATFTAGALGITVKALGAITEAVSGGRLGQGISKLGDGLLDLARKSKEFAAGRVESGMVTAGDFITRMSKNPFKAFPSGSRDRKIIRPSSPPGTPTPPEEDGSGDAVIIPDEKKLKQRADRITALMDRLTETIARHSKARTDDQLEDLRQLEREFKEIYGKKMPQAVVDGLQKIKDQIGKEGLATGLTKEVDAFIKTMDDPTRWEIGALGDYIDEMKVMRDTTEEGSIAWETLTTSIIRATEAHEDWVKKYKKSVKDSEDAEAKKVADALEEKMRKIRRVAEHTADAMADAFERFTTVMVKGSKRGEDAFEQLGRTIGRALMGALGEYAMTRARASYVEAAEAVARGIGYLSNPFLAPMAGGQFAAAAKFAAVGTMWAALGGVIGGATAGASASGMPAGEAAKNRVDDSRTQGAEINIYIDGVDPSNPRHQRLIGDTVAEYTERTGGSVTIHRRSP